MEQGSLPFTSNLARETRTRSMETVVAVLPPPNQAEITSNRARETRTRSMETVVAVLPPPNQAEMDELRMQSVERAAMTSSHFIQMTYDQLAQFHEQQEAWRSGWKMSLPY
ncbi:hypothetical protein B5M09_013505, partial [Aphanomyces astaci]